VANESAPIVWPTGQAFVVRASPVQDGLGRLTNSWFFRGGEGVFWAVWLLSHLRQQQKFAGEWRVFVRDLDAPKGATPVWQSRYLNQRSAEEAAFEITGLVRAGRLPDQP
jgi:hypothetical protein